MALKNYGVLKGRPVESRLGTGSSPHYQVRLSCDGEMFRIAINVKSQTSPSELLYLVVPRFSHVVCDRLAELSDGFHPHAPTPLGGGLDYIRANLFDPKQMRPLPFNLPGPDNDLNEKLDSLVQRAMSDGSAMMYAFGESWGPEPAADKYFGFKPGRGIHDIHMNQGNSGQFKADNGVWQDGGLIFHFPDQNQWSAVFLAFQSQKWHTDDKTGDPLEGPPDKPGEDGGGGLPWIGDLPDGQTPDGLVRIIGALVNASSSPEVEIVTLLNTSPRTIKLDGWVLLDKAKQRTTLSGEIGPGGVIQVQVKPPMSLSNKGGIITLLNHEGLKVNGVSYTKEQAKNAGWTLAF